MKLLRSFDVSMLPGAARVSFMPLSVKHAQNVAAEFAEDMVFAQATSALVCVEMRRALRLPDGDGGAAVPLEAVKLKKGETAMIYQLDAQAQFTFCLLTVEVT